MSHQKMRRPKPRRVLILAVLVGLVGFGAASSAYSDTGHDLPPREINFEGPVGTSQTTLARRAKMFITMPKVLGFGMTEPAYRTPYPNPGRRTPLPLPDVYQQSRVPGCQIKAIPVWTDLYVIAPTPDGQPVGEFPPTTVKMVAFGSIPVTATVHLSQVVNGELVPFQANFYPTNGNGPACDPDLRNIDPSTVTGQVSMRVSDLMVDGEPVDIGSHCQTVDPLEINLRGQDGYIPAKGGLIVQRKDSTEIGSTGYLTQPGSTDLTIPGFKDCASSSGEDVSRLITATISGPGNQIAVQQGRIFNNEHDRSNMLACLSDVAPVETFCPAEGPYPAPPTIPVPTD